MIGNESFLSELETTSFENINVRFKQNTDLGDIARHIAANVSLNMPAGLNDEQQQAIMIKNINDYFQTDQGAIYFDNIRTYAEAFASKINEAFNTLKDEVAPAVEDLTNKIEKQASELTAKTTELVNLSGELAPKQHNFSYVDLNKFKTTLSVTYASELVKKYMNNKITSVNSSVLRYILNAIPSIKNINVSNETLSNYTDMIVNDLTDISSKDKSLLQVSVLDTIKAAFNEHEYKSLQDLIFNNDIKYGKFNEDAIRHAYAYTQLKTIYDKLDSVVDLVDQEQLHTFKENMVVLEDLHKLSTVLLALASEKYEDAVVIGTNLINTNGFVKFQKAGGTEDDIANYIRLNYNHNKEDLLYNQAGHSEFPISGINCDSLVMSLDNTREKISKLHSQLESQYKTVYNNSVKKAYESVLKTYISDIEQYHPELIGGVDPHEFGNIARNIIPSISYNLTRFEHDNVTDAVYEFYLKLWYSNSLVSNIYYKLGASIVNNINLQNSIDQNTIEYAHFTVMSDIMSEYMAKNMIEPSK